MASPRIARFAFERSIESFHRLRLYYIFALTLRRTWDTRCRSECGKKMEKGEHRPVYCNEEYLTVCT